MASATRRKEHDAFGQLVLGSMFLFPSYLHLSSHQLLPAKIIFRSFLWKRNFQKTLVSRGIFLLWQPCAWFKRHQTYFEETPQNIKQNDAKHHFPFMSLFKPPHKEQDRFFSQNPHPNPQEPTPPHRPHPPHLQPPCCHRGAVGALRRSSLRRQGPQARGGPRGPEKRCFLSWVCLRWFLFLALTKVPFEDNFYFF